ncbi:MAG: hypothetical protein VYE77_06770 [Planctomycetota bacterium]|nr:hypothetical protein [Planctomycetota bacterium]
MRWRFWLLIFGLTLILFGGVQEIALWQVASRKPQVMTCQQLVDQGPGDNAHVELEKFLLLVNAFVHEVRGSQWSMAWVPAVPSGSGVSPAERAAAGDVRLLVKMPRARSMADVVETSQQPRLRGMVVNAIEELGPQEKALLERNYPGVDFGACYIFELGRRPASIVVILASVALGVGLILFVLWSLLGGSPSSGPKAGLSEDASGVPPDRSRGREQVLSGEV